MWLSKGKVPSLASEIVRAIVGQGLVETEAPGEVQSDVVAVLDQYVRDEQEISSRARDIASRRGGAPSEVGRVKRELAEQRGIGLGDDSIDYLLNQLIEMLMHSGSVEEIFAEDHQLKLVMRGPMRKLQAAEEQMEETVRKRMKHVQEGSSNWEIEYQRMRDEVTRRRS
jgi:hypothetical protein